MKRSFMTRALAFCLAASLLLGNVMPAYAAEVSGETLSGPSLSEPVEEPEIEESEIEDPEVPETQQYEPIIQVYVNPLYADVISEEEIMSQAAAAAISDDVTYYTSFDEAAVHMRKEMVNRSQSFTIGFEYDGEYDEEFVRNVSNQIAEMALEHTGNGKEGDYLKWQYGGWQSSIGISVSGETVSLVINYNVVYYTTAEQEEELDAEIANWVPSFMEESDFETIQNIYNYLCYYVTYDYSNLEDDNYLLKYTAYAAMIDGTAVCQGYATLFYRLALECGIDARVITGDAGGPHAWNIVQLNGEYYNLDSTWDSGGDTPIWFLLSEEDFTEHTRDEFYASGNFTALYQMAAESYVIDENPKGEPPVEGEDSEGDDPVGDMAEIAAPSFEVVYDDDGDFNEIRIINNASEDADISTGIISSDLLENSKLYAYSTEIESGASDTLSVSTIADYIVDYHRPKNGEYYFYAYARSMDTEAESELVVLEEYPITIENSVLEQTTVEERTANSAYYFKDFTSNDYMWAAYWIRYNDDGEFVEEHHIASEMQNIFYADKEYLDNEYDEWTFSRVAGISYDLENDGCTFNLCSAVNFVFEEYDESQISMPSFSSYFEDGEFENISIHNNDGDDRYIYYGFAMKDEIETGIELENAVGISPSEWTTMGIKDLVAKIPSKAGEYYLVAYAEDYDGNKSDLAVFRELPFVVKTVGSAEEVSILQGSTTGKLQIDGISPEDYLAVEATFLLKEYIDEEPENYTSSNLVEPFDDDDWDSFFISGSSMRSIENSCDEWSLEQLRFKNASVYNDVCKVTVIYNEEIVFETFEESVPEAPTIELERDNEGIVTGIHILNNSPEFSVFQYELMSEEEIENGKAPYYGKSVDGYEEWTMSIKDLVEDYAYPPGTYYFVGQIENYDDNLKSETVVLRDFPITINSTDSQDIFYYDTGDNTGYQYIRDILASEYDYVLLKCLINDGEDEWIEKEDLKYQNDRFFFDSSNYSDRYENWLINGLEIGKIEATHEACMVSKLLISSVEAGDTYEEPELEVPAVSLQRDDNNTVTGIHVEFNDSGSYEINYALLSEEEIENENCLNGWSYVFGESETDISLESLLRVTERSEGTYYFVVQVTDEDSMPTSERVVFEDYPFVITEEAVDETATYHTGDMTGYQYFTDFNRDEYDYMQLELVYDCDGEENTSFERVYTNSDGIFYFKNDDFDSWYVNWLLKRAIAVEIEAQEAICNVTHYSYDSVEQGEIYEEPKAVAPVLTLIEGEDGKVTSFNLYNNSSEWGEMQYGILTEEEIKNRKSPNIGWDFDGYAEEETTLKEVITARNHDWKAGTYYLVAQFKSYETEAYSELTVLEDFPIVITETESTDTYIYETGDSTGYYYFRDIAEGEYDYVTATLLCDDLESTWNAWPILNTNEGYYYLNPAEFDDWCGEWSIESLTIGTFSATLEGCSVSNMHIPSIEAGGIYEEPKLAAPAVSLQRDNDNTVTGIHVELNEPGSYELNYAILSEEEIENQNDLCCGSYLFGDSETDFSLELLLKLAECSEGTYYFVIQVTDEERMLRSERVVFEDYPFVITEEAVDETATYHTGDRTGYQYFTDFNRNEYNYMQLELVYGSAGEESTSLVGLYTNSEKIHYFIQDMFDSWYDNWSIRRAIAAKIHSQDTSCNVTKYLYDSVEQGAIYEEPEEPRAAAPTLTLHRDEHGNAIGVAVTNNISHDNGALLVELMSQDESEWEYLQYGRVDGESTSIYLFADISPYLDSFKNLENPINLKFVCTAEDPKVGLPSKETALDYPIILEFSKYSGGKIPVYQECIESAEATLYKFYVDTEKLPTEQTTYWLKYTAPSENGDYNQVYYEKLLLTDDGKQRYANVNIADGHLSVDGIVYRKLLTTDTNIEIQQGEISEEMISVTERELSRKQILLLDYDYYNAFIASGGAVTVENGEVVISTENFLHTIKWNLDYLYQWFEGTGLYRFVKNITNAVKEDANIYWNRKEGSFKAKNYYDIAGNEISEDLLSKHDIVLIEYAPEIVWVDSMELTAPKIMQPGEEATVEVTLDAGQDKYPFGRTPQVRFESSNPEVLSVDAETGKLTAGTKTGTATITAYADEELRAEEGLTEIVSESVEIAVEVEIEVPEQIIGVLAVGDEKGISLNWGISSEVDTEIYRIYRKTDDGEFGLLKEISGRNTLTYFDKNVELGKVYSYYVVGVGKYGQEGVLSDTVQASMLADQVAPVVTQLLPSNGSILAGTVVMGLLSKDNLAVTKAELHYSADNGETWNLLSESADGTFNVNIDTTQFTDGILQVKGIAYDANGNVSNPLIYKYLIDNMGPDQVQGLAAESTSVTITLRWNDVEAEDIHYFVVEERSADGQYVEIQKVYDTLGANIYGLKPATAHTYRVVGYDTQENRGTASEDVVIMTRADGRVPVITKLSPTFTYQKNTIELSAKAKDEYNVAKMTLQISTNGTEWTDVYTEAYEDVNKERLLKYTLPLLGYSEGYLFYRAVAEDAAGNVSDTSKDAPFVQYVIDRTAPEAPQNVTAEGGEGYIEISWSIGKEKDLGTYSVYRAEQEDGNYELLRNNLSSKNCIDRSIKDGKTYYYQVAVCDLAGNQSQYSATVSAQATPDTEKPEILSISPSGQYVGPEYKTIGVAVRDNSALETILVEYSTDNKSFKTLAEKTDLSTHSLTVAENLPIEGMNDGDIVYVRASVTDQSGNIGDSVSAQYTVDKTAPVLQNVTAEYADEKVVLNWSGNQETDLAGYRIYRAAENSDNYSLLRQYAATEGQTVYSYADQNLSTVKTSYKYKVEAVDLYGNASHVVTDSVEIPGTTDLSKVNLPEAVISCDPTFEVGVEYYIDASLSTDSEGIVSYHFDFGDGTESTSKKSVHKYDKVGDYTITLTVTDTDGNTATCEKQISVKERTLIGSVRIKVVDANGVAVPGASVYFNLGEENELVKKTDGQGYVTFSAAVGRHTVGCIIPDNEWLPTKKDIIVSSGEQTEITMTMVQHTMIEGEFEIKRMTFEEIVAAGIDVTAPENQYIVKVNVQLEYGSETIDTSFNYNETTGQIIGDPIIWDDRELIPHIIPSGGGGGNSGGSGGNGGGGYGGDYEFSKECTIAFLDVPIGVSALKEFFDVRLHIINNASAEFSMIDNRIELDIPTGLSVVETHTSEGKSVSIGEIKGQTTETITWILRGDEVGSYKIAADYAGVLAMFNEPIHTRFESSEPLVVRGLSDLKMRVEIPEELDRGTFYYNVMLINEGRLDVYRPNIDTKDILLETLVFDETGTRNVLNNTIDAITLSKLGIGTNISGNLNILGAGYSLMKHYMSVDQTEYTEQVLKLKKYSYEVQNTYGLEIEFVEKPVSYFKSNLNAEVNASEKAERTFKEGQSDYEALMNDQNYIYERLYSGALEGLTDKEDEIGWDLLGVAIGKAELKDLFGGDNEEAAAEILLDAMQIAAEGNDFTKFKIACDWTEAIAAWAAEKDLSKTEDAWVKKITSFIQENVSDLTEEQLKEMVVAYGEALKETYRVISVEHKWETYYTIFEGEYLDWDRMVIEKWQMILEEQFSETTIVLEETELSALMRSLCTEKSFEKVWNAVGIGGDVAGVLVNSAEKASADMSLYLAAQGNIESYNLFLDTIIDSNNENGSAGSVVKNAAKQVKNIINDKNLMGKLAARAADEAFWYMVEQGKEQCLDELDLTPSATVQAIKAALEIVYEVGNNVFNVEERHEIADNIRYVSAIGDSLAEGIESARKDYQIYASESYALPYMQLISYMIEMRRIGESQTAQFGVSYEVLPHIFDSRELFLKVKEISSADGAASWYEWRDVVEDRISIIRANLLNNPVAQDGESLAKPVVSFNYAKGQTVQKFSNIYEYSIDGGMSWIDCTGEEITLKPATCVRELQVRRKDVSDSTEKRTASLMIYGIPSIDKSGIQVFETERGYRFENLDNHKIYEAAFSNEKNSYQYEDVLEFAIPEGLYSFEYETDETYKYVYIRTMADSNQFASYICSAPIYPMQSVAVEVDGKGTVVGTGNYEHGEEATLIAQPNEHYKFAGWYQGDVPVSNQSVYTFKVLESESLIAKFVFDASSVVWVEAMELAAPQKIEIGETARITATPVPADGKVFVDAPELRFESSAPDILSVNAKTGELTALKLGTVTITVYADETLRREAGLEQIVTASATIQVVEVHEHVYDYELDTPATFEADGKLVGTCSCEESTDEKTIYRVASVELEETSYVYDGLDKEPVVIVKDSQGTALIAGTDYTVSYAENCNAGTATATVTLKGSYSGTKDVNFTIKQKSLVGAVVADIAPWIYTGSAIEPEVCVNLDDLELLLTDYTVSYANNINKGTATVTVTGKGNYYGTSIGTFEITARELEESMVAEIGTFEYTGKAIEPEVVVTFGETILAAGTDYTVSYSSNINAGTATVKVTGIGNFAGSAETYFGITPKMMNESLEVKIATQEYTGSEVKPAVIITDNGKTLFADVDFTVEYSDNVELGTATAVITGVRNYTGSITENFTITQKLLKSSMIAAITEQIYNGGEILPDVVVTADGNTLTEGDYIVEYSNNINAGIATVTVTGIGNYTGTATANFTIKAKTISISMIEDIMSEEYTGKALTPDVFLNDNDLDVSLEEGIDYTVSYSNNVNAGTATVKVIGKGNYVGTVTKAFRIEAREIGNCTVTVTEKMTYTGKSLIPTVTVKDGTVTLKNGTSYTISYSANKNPGEAIVKITGKGNYAGTVEESFVIVPKKATLNSVTASSSVEGRLTVKWTKDSLADGYMLQYSTDKNFASGVETEIINGAGTTSMTLNGLKEGKTYYVRVASFATVDDEEYRGSYSSAKSAKTKKGFSVKSIAEQDYTGKALKPKVTVKNGSTTLKEGTDYAVSYSNNTKPGEATVKVKGKGNYAGTENENFIIVPKKATLKSVTSTAVGNLKIKWSKDSLASGYILQYSTSSKFSSSKTVTLDITKNSTVSKTIKKLTEGKTYYVRVAAYKTIDGEDFLGNYSSKDSVKVKASFTVKAISDKTYTGSAIEPSVTVKFGSKTLKKGTDYTVSYSSNKNPGTATVKVTGKGNYAGTEKVTFKIVPKRATISTVKSTKAGRLTVKWEKDAKASGYVLQYSTSKKFTGFTTETIYIKKYSTVSKTIKNLVSGKKYYVRVAAYKNIDDVMERGSYSSVKYLKVK